MTLHLHTREIESLAPKVLQYATGCPEPTIIEHIRSAAVLLCRRTRCWRDIDRFETSGTESEVKPAIAPYAALYEIEKAWFNGQELERRSYSRDMLFHDEGLPQYFTQATLNSLLIEPRARGTLELSMFLMPSENAEVLPQFFFDQFPRELAEGALSTILMLPNQPYSDPNKAVFYENKFSSALDRNFSLNMRGQQRAARRSRASYF